MRRRRGRPLLRTAMVGGTAYVAAKKGAQNAELEAQHAQRESEPAPAPAGMTNEAIVSAGGFTLADEWIRPQNLVAAGLELADTPLGD